MQKSQLPWFCKKNQIPILLWSSVTWWFINADFRGGERRAEAVTCCPRGSKHPSWVRWAAQDVYASQWPPLLHPFTPSSFPIGRMEGFGLHGVWEKKTLKSWQISVWTWCQHLPWITHPSFSWVSKSIRWRWWYLFHQEHSRIKCDKNYKVPET